MIQRISLLILRSFILLLGAMLAAQAVFRQQGDWMIVAEMLGGTLTIALYTILGEE